MKAKHMILLPERHPLIQINCILTRIRSYGGMQKGSSPEFID